MLIFEAFLGIQSGNTKEAAGYGAGGSAGAQALIRPGACMITKANVKRGPRTELGSITI